MQFTREMCESGIPSVGVHQQNDAVQSILYDEHDTVSSATSSTSHFTARFTFIRIWRFINATNLTSSVAAGFGRHGMPPPASNPDLRPFDLETRMRDFANFPSKFGHASPLGSRIIRYAGLTRRMDGQTDGRTDKSNAYCPSPTVGGIIIIIIITKKYVLSNSESVQCNFFIFDHVTFIQFKICCCVQNFMKIR